ncbi:MAG: hypothetical protein RLZZ623_1593, partial [Actinomycetota bacterium]
MGPQQPFAVVVPYYSNPTYLRLALQSVLEQSDPQWWCTVVDDSPEGQGVADLVDEMSDTRFSYERNPTNLGVAGNFNRCFEIAIERGAELCVILHADDLLEPNYVATMTEAHRRQPHAVCVAPKVTVIDAVGLSYLPLPDRVKAWLWPRRIDRLEGEHGLRLLLRGQFFYCPAVSYRMALVPRPAWDQRWNQVMDLMLYGRVLLAGGSIALEPSSVYRYRRHAASETQVNTATLARTVEELAALRELTQYASGLQWRRAKRAGKLRVTHRASALVFAFNLLLNKQSGRGLRLIRI